MIECEKLVRIATACRLGLISLVGKYGSIFFMFPKEEGGLQRHVGMQSGIIDIAFAPPLTKRAPDDRPAHQFAITQQSTGGKGPPVL
jgi:hypothetical protein